MKTLNCIQGSTEWHAARKGVVTASEIDALVTPEWKVRTGEGVTTYLHTKLAEAVLGYSASEMHGGGSFAMEQGQLLEKMAVPFFELVTDLGVDRVGFCVSDDGRIGCSPDGLIGYDGGIEIKCPLPPKHLEYLLGNEVPKAYRAQVQFSMYVTGRRWWKFMSFYPYTQHMRPLIVHVEADPKAHESFTIALDMFFERFDAARAKVEAMQTQGGRA